MLSDRTLLQGLGAAGLLGPALLSGNTALTNRATTQSLSTTSMLVVEPALTTIGPSLLQVGDIGACAGFDTASNMPFGCNPTAGRQFLVVPGTINIDVNTHTFITQTITNTTTNTFTTTQVYSLTGLPPSSVPEPGTIVLTAVGILWFCGRRFDNSSFGK